MLLAMLLVSLLIYAWGLFSKYQSANDELAEIENISKFNEQFTNYDRKDVMGYELVSLINKVIDYNYRESNDADARNDKKYDIVTLEIDLKNLNNFSVKENLPQLFKNKILTQTKATKDTELKVIFENINRIEKSYGGAGPATNIAKAYNDLFVEELVNMDDNERYFAGVAKAYKEEKINKFNSYSKNIKCVYSSSWTVKQKYYNFYQAQHEEVEKYCEFVNFKSAEFSCTKVGYDNVSGRVNLITFECNAN